MNCQGDVLMSRLAITAACLLAASTAWGQFSQTGGQTYGAFGNRSVGQGMSSGSSGFSSGNASSSMGSSSMGGNMSSGNSMGGNMNSGNMSSGSSGNSGIGQLASQQFSLGSSLPGQNRASAGFIGADAGDSNAVANVRSMQGMGQGNQGMNSLFGANGAFSQFARQNQQRNQNQNQNQNGQNNGKKQLRISIKASIPTKSPASTPTALGHQFQTRLKKLPGLDKSDVTVSMQGRTAVLEGTVASQHDRDVIAGLALLEPGISAVRNELAVAEELPSPAR